MSTAHRIVVVVACSVAMALSVSITTQASSPLPLTLASGWHATVAANGRVAVVGPHDAEGTVWPFVVPSPLSDQGAKSALVAILRRYYAAGTTWSAPAMRSTGTLIANGSGGDRRAVAVLRYAKLSNATVATLYTASSGSAYARDQQSQFAQMFSSFHPRGSGSSNGSGAPAISYASWREPNEGAFTIDAPRGWNVTGGLARYGTVDVRTGVKISSTALDASVLFGDSSVPTYVEMNAAFQLAGLREGQVYTNPYGTKETILSYLPGLSFAQRYASALAAANSCSDLKVQSARERPDTVAALNRINQQFGMIGANVRTDAGEVAFTCQANGKVYDGYVFASTTEVQAGGQALWQVPYLYVATAKPSSMATAEAVLQHVVGSFKQDPSWTARQSQLSASSAQIASAAGNAIADSISSSYWAKVASDDQLSQERSDATLGLTNTVDPVTGDAFKVQSNSSYYWIDHAGNIVGTDTSAAPSVDFRSLVTLAR